MQTPKELFLKKEDLRGQLATVVNADWFQECICFTVAQMHHDHVLLADEMRGVTLFLSVFRQMHQKPEPEQAPISPGLQPLPAPKHPR